jgi:hypothetical protein
MCEHSNTTHALTAIALSLALTACGDDGAPHHDASARAADARTADALCTTCTADATATSDASPIDAPVADAITSDAMISQVSFSQGVAGYSDTHDTTLLLSLPNSTFGTLSDFGWDAAGSAGLLRFDSIFGSAGTQVPAGATIVSATLTITLSNDSDINARLHNVLVPWDEATVTYNSFGPTPGVDTGVDYDPAVVASVPPTGVAQLDVTASVAAWSASPSTNHGWLFLTTSTDGALANSSEASSARPVLTISYTP